MWHLSALIAALPTPPAESEPFGHYAPVGLLLLMALVFGAGTVIAAQVIDRLTGIRRQGSVKSMTYESGMNPIGSARQRFNVRFYIVAVTFLVFRR